MSTLERRKILNLRRQEAHERQEAEERRVAELSDYERIEEIDSFRELKDFLHILSDRIENIQRGNLV